MIDLTNRKFKFLTPRWPAAFIKHGRGVAACWLCTCVCGNLIIVRAHALLSGNTKSCGCFKISVLLERVVTHGQSRNRKLTPTYRSWRAMIRRCRDRKQKTWKAYGGAGVRVSKRWMDFKNFLADLGPRPDGTTLGRLRDSGNYKSGNCQWMTPSEQGKNRHLKKISERGERCPDSC